MKKVILTGVSLMTFAAAGFAQNNATLNQVGTQQTSTQKQTGNHLTSVVTQGNGAVGDNTGNTSYTEQKAQNNTATVTQTTSQYNQALIYQNTVNGPASPAPANNEATIQQIGSGSTALLPGDPNNTPAPTSGVYGNVARIGQEQTNNKALIQQNGGGSSNYSNYGRIDQAGLHNGNGLTPTTITQNGQSQGNVGSITQLGYNNQNTFIDQSTNSIQNKASITQSSDYNQASVTQDNNSSGNTGTITQQGNSGSGAGNNQAYMQQNGAGSNASSGNAGTITQSLFGNNANMRQNGGADGSSTGNTATITQSGFDNHSAIGDHNGFDYGADTYVSQSNNSHDNTATVNQPGNWNVAHVNQDNNSHNNTATVYQSGINLPNLSLATINQSNNSYRNDATVNQTGYDNERGTVNQTSNSHHNSGTIQQDGRDDNATINQVTETANNKATINQGGNGTTSTHNTATVTQSYAYDPTTTAQPAGTGAGNNVTVNQNQASIGHDNVAVVLQGGDAANITSSSKVNIDQDNSNNSAYLTQTGQTLTASVKQTGDFNMVRGTSGAADPAMDPALQLGSNHTLTITQSVQSGSTASVSVNNTANVHINAIGGSAIITQTLITN